MPPRKKVLNNRVLKIVDHSAPNNPADALEVAARAAATLERRRAAGRASAAARRAAHGTAQPPRTGAGVGGGGQKRRASNSSPTAEAATEAAEEAAAAAAPASNATTSHGVAAPAGSDATANAPALRQHLTLGSGPLGLLRDSYRAAAMERHASSGHPYGDREPVGAGLILGNARVWDEEEMRFLPPRHVVVVGRKIAGVQEDESFALCEGIIGMEEAGIHGAQDSDFVHIDCGGMWLLPGLCDAHVHVTAVTADLAALQSLPESLVTAGAARVLEGMLLRGFTTVRDAGGADWGLARAVEHGLVMGPRLLFTGE